MDLTKFRSIIDYASTVDLPYFILLIDITEKMYKKNFSKSMFELSNLNYFECLNL